MAWTATLIKFSVKQNHPLCTLIQILIPRGNSIAKIQWKKDVFKWQREAATDSSSRAQWEMPHLESKANEKISQNKSFHYSTPLYRWMHSSWHQSKLQHTWSEITAWTLVLFWGQTLSWPSVHTLSSINETELKAPTSTVWLRKLQFLQLSYHSVC